MNKIDAFITQRRYLCYKNHTDMEDLKEFVRNEKSLFKFNCQDCDWGTNGKGAYDTHMRRFHFGLTYPCEHCEHISYTVADSIDIRRLRNLF